MSALKKALIITFRNRRGGLTEWLRSSPGKRVGCNSLVGSSPMSSAKNLNLSEKLRFFYFQRFPVFPMVSAILRIDFQRYVEVLRGRLEARKMG